MPHSSPPYPPELYPHSKAQLQQILTDYYSLTLQLQTLQRHILKIQTQNQHKHKIFNDQVQKLKLYIDQCENQIRKRQERQLILIERLKELENSHCEEIQELKFSRNQQKANQKMLVEFENIMKEKQDEWNHERLALINDNESIMRENIQLNKEITAMKILIDQIQTQKQSLLIDLQKLSSQTTPIQSQIIRLKQQLQSADQNIERLEQQNDQLRAQVQQLNVIKDNTLRQLSQRQQVFPISSSCLNCLKLTKMHQTEMEKKNKQIQSLKKDVESLLAFFQLEN